MSDLAVTPERLRKMEVIEARLIPMIADEAIQKGQAVYRKATGRAGLGSSGAVATAKPVGVATTSVQPGTAFDALYHGMLAGYDLGDVDPGTTVYLSDTAGAVADAAGTVSVPIGTVHTLTDVTFTKVVFIDIPQNAVPVEGGV